MIRVGLVGYGLAGSVFHAPLIAATPRMTLTAVMTSREAPHAVLDLELLLGRADLVVIASPHRSHFPLARRALEAGKHVVVDKPFTVTVAEADALIALAAERERVIVPFHNRRWDGDFLTVETLLPRLGEVSLFEAHWDRFRPGLREGWKEDPEQAAGLLIDLGPHLVDQALRLFGLPEAVGADLLAQRPGSRVDDYFALTLHYGRMRALLCASTLVAAPRPRFAVHGTAGSFVRFGIDPQEEALKAGADPREAGRDAGQGMLTLADGTRQAVPTERGRYLDFYGGVADAILDGAPVPVEAADAREGLRILEAARESSREGRVVRL
ncbi:MAG TPA: Gfo/Idh/MocA family oxidoreductase [Allosphingosinicella sp.]